jgi:hypothetical protein
MRHFGFSHTNGEGGRGAQPGVIIGSRVQWTHPITPAMQTS